SGLGTALLAGVAAAFVGESVAALAVSELGPRVGHQVSAGNAAFLRARRALGNGGVAIGRSASELRGRVGRGVTVAARGTVGRSVAVGLGLAVRLRESKRLSLSLATVGGGRNTRRNRLAADAVLSDGVRVTRAIAD